MAGIEGFFVPFQNPLLILLAAIGTFFGVYMAAIPGLSVTMTISLLISFTYSWDIYPALAVMLGIYAGGIFGGSRTAILLNIPGAPNSIATSFDGYPLAKQGQAGEAMGLATTVSTFGGIFGILMLMFFSPLVAKLSSSFAARDFFLLGIMGLTLVGSFSSESIWKSLVSACLGLFVSMIGVDNITGQPRLNFGQYSLMGGINFIVVMIGLFGLSEVFVQVKIKTKPIKQKVKRVIPKWSLVKENLPLALRCSCIGTFIGALPGVGGDIAALISYDHAKRTTIKPYPNDFGKGAYQGIIAPESSNNASMGGALVPMLTLGIPGDSATAVLIGALTIHGLRPGPMLLIDQPEFYWTIVSMALIVNILIYVAGISGIRVFSKILDIRKEILYPCIVAITVVGAYSMNNNLVDIYWMFAFGILGYLMKSYGYSVATMILGVILGPIIETNLRRAVAITNNSLAAFFFDLFQHPITLILLLGIAFSFVSQTQRYKNFIKKMRSIKAVKNEVS